MPEPFDDREIFQLMFENGVSINNICLYCILNNFIKMHKVSK